MINRLNTIPSLDFRNRKNCLLADLCGHVACGTSAFPGALCIVRRAVLSDAPRRALSEESRSPQPSQFLSGEVGNRIDGDRAQVLPLYLRLYAGRGEDAAHVFRGALPPDEV